MGELNGTPATALREAIGNSPAPTNDPAWQPPRDPLAGADIKAMAGAVSREIPIVAVSTGWDVSATRGALSDLVVGLFDRPAQLVDSTVGDSRVQAGMASRVGGTLGRPVTFRVPRTLRDSDAAKECRDAFVDAWPTMGAEPILSELQSWAVMLGFGPAQILWDTSGKYAIPHARPWHPRYTYYHWIYRCYVAITQDGQTPILAGDGHWMLHAPHGEYRGWMRGAVRAIAPWWLARNYALRDWARYSERHGLPMIKAMTPAMGDPVQMSNFRAALANLGQESVIHLPQSTQPGVSYDVNLMEASDGAWEGFSGLIRQCDTEITLSLLAQNLTTEVKEGSYAAARVHADVRQALLEADARALAQTIYMQLARPFAAMNFGDPDLAPLVNWDVRPYEDSQTAAQTLMTFAQALYALRTAGKAPKDVSHLAASFGLELGNLIDVEPLQVASSANSKAAVAAAKEQAKDQAKAAEKARGSAPSKRFVAMAEKQMALRFEAGASAAELARENAAIAEMLAEAEGERGKRTKAARA